MSCLLLIPKALVSFVSKGIAIRVEFFGKQLVKESKEYSILSRARVVYVVVSVKVLLIE